MEFNDGFVREHEADEDKVERYSLYRDYGYD